MRPVTRQCATFLDLFLDGAVVGVTGGEFLHQHRS